MTPVVSVLEKAQALQAEANRLREGEAAHNEAIRVSNRVDEILAALATLRQVVATARRLQSVAETPIDVFGVDDGRAVFARLASSGLPPNPVFTTAKKKIDGASARIGQEVAAAWATWTGEQISALPLIRIALLPSQAQATARKAKDELQKLARKPAPTSEDTDLFLAAHTIAAGLLGTVTDPPPEVLELLHRLGERPALTLRDVTDEQLALLRAADIDDQIELKRVGM